MVRLNPTSLILLGVTFTFIGTLIIFLSFLIGGSGSVSTGIIIFIGPFPIVFGSGEHGDLLILIGLTIMILMIAISYIMFRQRKG